MNHSMDRLRERLGGIAFGGDYNPEQWPRDVWREDVSLMREAGVNIVTVGVFSWSVLEPEDGRFEFEWLDEVLDLLHAGGIAVDLATPNAAPPPWMAEDHPESMMVDRDGRRMATGSRGHFCPSSSVYRDRSLRIARRLAERYGNHPALAMWHVGNEYHSECFCMLCDDAFRNWLQQRYGSLEELNSRWGTAQWSQQYSRWTQVHLPQPVRGRVNPSRQLDYSRFNSDSQLELFTRERDLLHAIAPGVPVTTNFFQSVSLNDYHRWGAEVDVVTFDTYPDPGSPGSGVNAAIDYDLMRSIGGGKPWMVLEQAASAVSQWKRNYVKQPEQMRRDAYSTLAHGSDSVMFFQWRASPSGQEKFHSAMLPHSGTETRSWKEVSTLGRELPLLAEVAGSRVHAEVAMVWDWENWWAVEGCFHPANDFSYRAALTEYYAPLWEHNLTADIVTLGSDLSRYKVLIVPHLYLMTAEQSTELRRFVESGGHVIVTYFSGIVDENDRIVEGGYPGALHDVIGGRVLEFSPMLPDAEVGIRGLDGQDLFPTATSGRGRRWQDDLVAEGAQVVAEYTDGYLAGHPAVLDHRLGAGSCVYLGSTLDSDSYAAVTDRLIHRAGVRPAAEVPRGIRAHERHTEEFTYLFLLNHGEAASFVLDRTGTDLLTDRVWEIGEPLEMDRSEVIIVRSER